MLISVDTLRADHLHSYGGASATSPFLDALAQEGVRFASVSSASNWTLPSHASMLTGLDPAGHGAVSFHPGEQIDAAVTTLAEYFKATGFQTAGFVGGGWVSPPQGFERGFDFFWSSDQSYLFPGRLAQALAEARAWLSRHPRERFFLFLHTYQVHMPYTPPASNVEPFTVGLAAPQRLSLSFQDLAGWARDWRNDPQDLPRIRALYDAEIRYADELIGGFVEDLRIAGLADSTCVLVTSDHGEEFAEHGDLFHEKAKLYQELLSVPLLVWCPGRLLEGHVVEEPVGLVDVTPTALDLAGVAIPANLDGVSLLPQLLGRPGEPDRVLLSDVDLSLEIASDRFGAVRKSGESREASPDVAGGSANSAAADFILALRSGSLKLLYHSDTERSELFDLASDPGETRDLSAERPEWLATFELALAEALVRRAALVPSGSSSPGGEALDPKLLDQLRELGYSE
ncbi:sulfatase [Myxococcota bacterium]|nr:sulfatase [Myxococcota bacterium]